MAVFDWIIVVIGLFIITIFYFVGSVIIVENVIPQINSTSLGVATAEQQQVYENVVDAWNIILWIFVFGLLFFGFVSSQRREPDTGVSGFV